MLDWALSERITREGIRNNMDGNCNALFIVNAEMSSESEMDPDVPLAEGNTLAEVGEQLVAGDYEGIMQLTVIESGDVLDIEVSFHITEDKLVDVEAL